MENTTIAISKDIKEKLNAFGAKGETYNELIAQLIEIAEKSEFLEKQKSILRTERFVSVDKL
jgi:predicted CopG family antitoxin